MKLLIVVGVLRCFGSIFVDGQVQTYLKGSNRGKIWQQNDNNNELTLTEFRKAQDGDNKQSLLALIAEDENRRLGTTQVTFYFFFFRILHINCKLKCIFYIGDDNYP